MVRYGVKTKGKVIWILADGVRVEEGVILFTRNVPDSDKVDIVAGFNLATIDHFGRPDVFAKEPPGSEGRPAEN